MRNRCVERRENKQTQRPRFILPRSKNHSFAVYSKTPRNIETVSKREVELKSDPGWDSFTQVVKYYIFRRTCVCLERDYLSQRQTRDCRVLWRWRGRKKRHIFFLWGLFFWVTFLDSFSALFLRNNNWNVFGQFWTLFRTSVVFVDQVRTVLSTGKK